VLSVTVEQGSLPALESRTPSLEGRTLLFVVGCPRSGTTWVQLLLSQHPDVVSAPETHIFSFYLDRMRRQWEAEHRNAVGEQGSLGLSRVLSCEDFDELCRRAAGFVLERVAARDTHATVVMEKSPQHALQADLIHRLFPAARFLHVIRDPRDTVASLRAAARRWARAWSTSTVEAARLWERHVQGARRLVGTGELYREVRYEGLHADAPAQLGGIFRWLGLDADPAFCRRAVEACRIERVREAGTRAAAALPGSRLPKTFFRRGNVGDWRGDLSRLNARTVECICGELMDELGYPRAFSGASMAPLRIRVHDGVQRVRESIDWQLERLLHHV
jgi:Sulfotransferase family